MADINDLLSKIDPTDALIAYIQEVKPYHSKILDVLVEYVVTDTVGVTFADKFTPIVRLETNVKEPIMHSCGYGFVWNPYSGVTAGNLPTVNIMSAASTGNGNTFYVQMPAQTVYSAIVTSVPSNQLTLVTPYNVASVDADNQRWFVAGNITADLPAGAVLYISSNTGVGANGRYTVASSVFTAGQTRVTVVEPIPLSATSTGKLNIPTFALSTDVLPYWPLNAGVKLSTTGTMPGGLTAGQTYYFQPSSNYGYFNLSEERYPRAYEDIVNITSTGVGELTIVRSEPFVPGEYLIAAGTPGGVNDGNFTVNTVTPAFGNFFDIGVFEIVQTQGVGGTLKYFGSYGDPYCPLASAPDMHAEAYITEKLEFVFDPIPPV